MVKRILIRKAKKLLKRLWKRAKRTVVIAGLAFVIISAAGITVHISTMKKPIDPAAYKPLLNLIAKAESNGNYNAYFGDSANTKVAFTSMSIADVLKWQQAFIQNGSPSSAVGRYQLLDTTLSGLVQRLKINPALKFNAAMQDRLAVALLEKRGAESYMEGTLSKEDFAANLAKEWAALPKVIGDNPQNSYYANDGLNASRVSVNEVLTVTEKIKQN